MLGISVELGTYSIKFISYHIDKKKTKLLSTDEIVIDHHADQEINEKDYDLWKEQLEILQNYLEKLGDDYQLMMNIPSQIVSTRYIELPVKSKKKAIQMLPYQIEEDLPFSLADCTLAESLAVEGEHTKAMVGIVKNQHFFHFYELLKEYNISPQVLTTDTSNYANIVKSHKEEFPHAFSIINFGHETTRGFYFHNGELVSNHQSYLAGNSITEAIEKNYKISYDEATLYKHQNSFLLLEEQYDQVNENQKDFAKMMDSALGLLISEIKRWDIGYRVQFGEPIKEIYICGGTSNIKNFKNYLSSKLNIEIHFFNPYQYLDDSKIDQDEKLRRKFSQITALSTNAVQRSGMINFLKGEYALSSGASIPFESISFLSIRTAILAIIVSSFLLTNFFITGSRINNANRTLNNLKKNTVLKKVMTKRAMLGVTKKYNEKQANQILKKLTTQERTVKQEITTIQSALNTNSFGNLQIFLNYIGTNKVEVIKFIANETNDIDFVIKAKAPAILTNIEKRLKADKANKWSSKIDNQELTLSAKTMGKK